MPIDRLCNQPAARLLSRLCWLVPAPILPAEEEPPPPRVIASYSECAEYYEVYDEPVCTLASGERAIVRPAPGADQVPGAQR